MYNIICIILCYSIYTYIHIYICVYIYIYIYIPEVLKSRTVLSLRAGSYLKLSFSILS